MSVFSQDVPRENWIWERSSELVAGFLDRLAATLAGPATLVKPVLWDRRWNVDKGFRDKLTALPPFKGLAKDGRREEASLPVVAEVAGRYKI
jgi:hypothetical protein